MSTEYDQFLSDLVEKATDSSLIGDNWELIFDVTDSVNEDPQGASKLIIYHLCNRIMDSDNNIQLRSLSLLTALAENCGIELKREIATESFAAILFKKLADNTVHKDIKLRIGEVVTQLSNSFEGEASLSQIHLTYQEMNRLYASYLPKSGQDDSDLDDDMKAALQASLQDDTRASFRRYKTQRQQTPPKPKTHPIPPPVPKPRQSRTPPQDQPLPPVPQQQPQLKTTQQQQQQQQQIPQPQQSLPYQPVQPQSQHQVLHSHPQAQPQLQTQQQQQQQQQQPTRLAHQSQNQFLQPQLHHFQPSQGESANSQQQGRQTKQNNQRRQSQPTFTRVRALYNSAGEDPNDLKFQKGDIIAVIEKIYGDWGKGSLNGVIGLFPYNYVSPLYEPSLEELQKDSEMEHLIFQRSRKVEQLLTLLTSALNSEEGIRSTNNNEFRTLYQELTVIKPDLVTLIDQYRQREKDLLDFHQKLKKASDMFEKLSDPVSAQVRQQQRNSTLILDQQQQQQQYAVQSSQTPYLEQAKHHHSSLVPPEGYKHPSSPQQQYQQQYQQPHYQQSQQHQYQAAQYQTLPQSQSQSHQQDQEQHQTYSQNSQQYQQKVTAQHPTPEQYQHQNISDVGNSAFQRASQRGPAQVEEVLLSKSPSKYDQPQHQSDEAFFNKQYKEPYQQPQLPYPTSDPYPDFGQASKAGQHSRTSESLPISVTTVSSSPQIPYDQLEHQQHESEELNLHHSEEPQEEISHSEQTPYSNTVDTVNDQVSQLYMESAPLQFQAPETPYTQSYSVHSSQERLHQHQGQTATYPIKELFLSEQPDLTLSNVASPQASPQLGGMPPIPQTTSLLN